MPLDGIEAILRQQPRSVPLELAGSPVQDSGYHICQEEQSFDLDTCTTAVVNCVRRSAASESNYRASTLTGREGGVLFIAFRGARPGSLAGSYDCVLPPRSHQERALAVRTRAFGPYLSARWIDSGDWNSRKARKMVTLLVRPERHNSLISLSLDNSFRAGRLSLSGQTGITIEF